MNNTYTKSFYCEFDKFASKSYAAIHHVSEDTNIGDINKVDEKNMPYFNVICGGSPCQDFSISGKQKGSVWTCKACGHKYNPLTVHYSKREECPVCHSKDLEKTRSSLLVEWLRMIRGNKPKWGIYENVKNIVGKQFKDTTFKLFEEELNEYGYNTYWKVLNGKNYGIPQNRERLYLVIIRKELDNGKFVFPEPFDNGMRLKDLLEDNVDEKYYLSDEKVAELIKTLDIRKLENTCNEVNQIGNVQKSSGCWNNPQCGRVYSPNNCSPTLNTCGGGNHEPKIIQIGNVNPSGKGMNGNVFDENGLAPTLTTNKGEGNKIAVHQNVKKECPESKIICGMDKSKNNPRLIENANCLTAREDRGISNHKQEGTAVIEYNTLNKKDGMISVRQATQKGYAEVEQGGVADLSYPKLNTRRGRVQEEGCICPTLTATETGVHRLESEIRIRKLTPKETFRLMGFTDEDFANASRVCSNAQLYKQSGNSIIVDVLFYIFKNLKEAMPYLFDDVHLGSFFSGIGAFECALDRLYNEENGNFTNPQTE